MGDRLWTVDSLCLGSREVRRATSEQGSIAKCISAAKGLVTI
ncbi:MULTISPECIES: hypothetical protein [Nostocales]|uniref:Transposase n=2 Tax=Nostocales TaxID=1161 RepID=A0ABW8WIY0_9CYAN|nr:hypothetical protein [Tolypothrix bouteillei]